MLSFHCKGERTECTNCKCINVVGKIYAGILMISGLTDDDEEGSGCVDQYLRIKEEQEKINAQYIWVSWIWRITIGIFLQRAELKAS